MSLLKAVRVSIVIPVYNRDYIISRAVQSVLQQSFKDFEVIIVDDGSTDKLEEVLKTYSDPRLIVIKHPRNKGAAAARNTAIKAAQGSLIAFLDSDDEWASEKLEKQVKHFDNLRHNNKNIMASFTWFFLHRQNGLAEMRQFRKIRNWKKYFLEGCFISPGSTLLVDKKAYEEVGLYDESLKRFEDWDWLIRFSKKFGLVAYEKPLSSIHQGSIPSYQDVFSSFKEIFHKNKKELTFFEKIKLFSSGHIELYHSCRKNYFFKAYGHFFLAIMMNPFLLKRVIRALKLPA